MYAIRSYYVDATGKLVTTDTVYPFEPRKQYDQAIHRLQVLDDINQTREQLANNREQTRNNFV